MNGRSGPLDRHSQEVDARIDKRLDLDARIVGDATKLPVGLPEPMARCLCLRLILGRDRKFLLDLADFVRCMFSEQALHIGGKFA